MENNSISNEEKINRIIRRKTMLSFTVLFAGFAFAFLGWNWLNNQPKDNEQPKPLRTVLNGNEKVNALFFSNKHLAKRYPKTAAAKEVRVNGDLGMNEDFDPELWVLTINKHNNNMPGDAFLLKLADVKALPKQEEIFNFKCIEGWSQISHWGGVLFSDFMLKYHLGTRSGNAPDPKHPEDLYKYVGLITPDGEYYVGIDMKSMMHKQTLLCYEMNAEALPMNQGYPLRLIIPVKYGIKSLKRIGRIYFSDTRPPDYWYEHGYDYDAAL
jgi:hypothetical protein